MVFGTFLVLACLFGYYFWVYLPNQENLLISRRVRALQQIATNFKTNYGVFGKTSEAAFNRLQEFRSASRKKGNQLETFKSLNDHITRQALNKNLALKPENYKSRGNEIEFSYPFNYIQDDTIRNTIKFVGIVDDIFRAVLLKEDFDQYILFHDNRVAFRTIDSETLQLTINASGLSLNVDSLLKGSGSKAITLQLDQFNQRKEKFKAGLDVELLANEYKLFSTHFKTDDSEEWSIYALSNAEKFEMEMKKIPTMVIISIGMLILILVFSLPLIKISLMSKIERLNRVDVVTSALTFVVTSSLVVLFYLLIIAYQSDSRKIDDRLSNLSDNIQDSLHHSLRNIVHQMQLLESAAYEYAKKDSATDISIFSDVTFSNQFKPYLFMKNLYWMDQSGFSRYQVSSVSPKNQMLENNNFGARPYFKEIQEGGGWRSDEIVKEKPFYLQSIISWTNSEKLLVLSIPPDRSGFATSNDTIKNISVLAASLRFHTIIDPVLPQAYSFAIIDRDGETLFHSNNIKNLQENFLTEVGDNKELLSATIGNIGNFIEVNKGGDEQRVYIRPIAGLPWMLITSFDQSYAASPYLEIMSLSVGCILTIGFFSFLQLFFISLFKRRHTKLKRQFFYYEWLWPGKANKKKYANLMVYNVALAIILLLYHVIFNLKVPQVLSSFIYIVLISNATAWLLLEGDITLKSWTTRTILGVSLIFSLIIYALTSYLVGEAWLNLIILLLIVTASFALVYFRDQLADFIRKYTNIDKLNYRYTFWGMLFTFLIVSSVLPSFFIFQSSYKQEQNIWKKYEMQRISKFIIQKNEYLENVYPVTKLNTYDTLLAEIRKNKITSNQLDRAKKAGNFFRVLGYNGFGYNPFVASENTRWDSLYFVFRPFFNDLYVATNSFVFSESMDGWKSSIDRKDGHRLEYNDYSLKPESKVLLETSIIKLDWGHITGSLGGVLFWVALVILLAVIALLIRFATNIFFGLNLFNNLQPLQVDDKYLEVYFEKNIIKGTQKHLFIITMPFTGTFQLYNRDYFKPFDVPSLLVKEKKEEIMKIEMENVVLEHFSYLIEDTTANKEILEIVESLLRNKNTIIIVSRLSPSQITELYEEIIQHTTDPQKRAELEIQISKWKDILAGFVKAYYSLLQKEKQNEKYSDSFSVKQLIKYEFRVNEPYFRRIREAFTTTWNDDRIELISELKRAEKNRKLNPQRFADIKEEVILKIQSMAQPFYFSLWNTCSKEEKYLLYDLAMDGFVNPQNEKGLKKLLEKGLIYYGDSLQIMNESFRNFILSTIKESESLAMEKEMRRTGTWSVTSSIILILIISLIAFLSLSQKEVINQFFALIVGLTTAVPYLLRFSGLFSSLTGSKSAKSDT